MTQVLLTLCRTLEQLYMQLRDALRTELRTQGVVDLSALAALVKLDGRIQQHVISIVSKELTEYAEHKMSHELESIAYCGGASQQQPIGRDYSEHLSPVVPENLCNDKQ